MLSRRAVWILAMVVAAIGSATGFVVAPRTPVVVVSSATTTTTVMHMFNKKKQKEIEEDLSYIESREMTREEMLQLNQKNEDIMNAELFGMTLFSLILCVPLLYLVWVGFFSETSEIANDISSY